MSKENRVSDERLTELFAAAEAGISRPDGILGALSGHVIVPPSDLKAIVAELQSLRSQSLSTQQPMGEVTDEMIERGLLQYSEGGCMGLSQEERREVVASILTAALHPNQESGE